MSDLAPWIGVLAVGGGAVVLFGLVLGGLRAAQNLSFSRDTGLLMLGTLMAVYTVVVVLAGRWDDLTAPLTLAVWGAYHLAERARSSLGRWGFWVLGVLLSVALIVLGLLDDRFDLWLGAMLTAFATVLAWVAWLTARRLLLAAKSETSPPTETGTPA